MKPKLYELRWKLADGLSFVACWLRGHKHAQLKYNYPGVRGNRAAELVDGLWQLCVMANHPKPSDKYLDEIEAMLHELGKLAGQNWWYGKPNL